MSPRRALADAKKAGNDVNPLSTWLKSVAGSAAKLVLLLAILLGLIWLNWVPPHVIPCQSLDSIRGFFGWHKLCQR